MSDETTCDSVLCGALRLHQPKQGYRFSIDPLLLADFVQPTGEAVVDLGSGCGVLALALALRMPSAQVTAIELQPRLAKLAAQNVEENRLAHRVRVHQANLCRLDGVIPGRAFDLVVSNPPYQRADGRLNPSSEKAVARHELACTLADLLTASARLLRPQGRLGLIYPAERLAEVMNAMAEKAMGPVRLRMVHPRIEEPARLFMVEAVVGAAPKLSVLAPLIVHRDSTRNYTPEVAKILGEKP